MLHIPESNLFFKHNTILNLMVIGQSFLFCRNSEKQFEQKYVWAMYINRLHDVTNTHSAKISESDGIFFTSKQLQLNNFSNYFQGTEKHFKKLIPRSYVSTSIHSFLKFDNKYNFNDSELTKPETKTKRMVRIGLNVFYVFCVYNYFVWNIVLNGSDYLLYEKFVQNVIIKLFSSYYKFSIT